MILFFGCNNEKKINHFYSNGKLKEEYYLVNDTVTGDLTSFYEDGNIKSITPYVNNAPNGFYAEYYNTGSLKTSYYLKNSHKEGLKFTYDINGNVIEKSKFINGKRNGIYREYGSNGNLKTLALFYNNKEICLVSDELRNDNFKANNYLDIIQKDTLSEPIFEAKIVVRNCTYNKIAFYEGRIDTTRYYDLIDTLNIFHQVNDSIVIYRSTKATCCI